jgi:hypothetical protein
MFKDKTEERGEVSPEFESTQPWEDRIYGQPWRAKLRVRAPSAPQSPEARRQPLISPPAADEDRAETSRGPRMSSIVYHWDRTI